MSLSPDATNYPRSINKYLGLTLKSIGTFGAVYKAQDGESGLTVAIKRVAVTTGASQNRELAFLLKMDHPNIIKVLDHFLAMNRGQMYLHMVMEYLPHSLLQLRSWPLEMIELKVYSYQLFRAIAYIHSMQLIHRDIKPHNILVDMNTHRLKLVDFGSARKDTCRAVRQVYICSRFYRAPELLLEASEYGVAIDLWSAGCVLAEMFLGQPLFRAENATQMLLRIVAVIGTPSEHEIKAMQAKAIRHGDLCNIEPLQWSQVFPASVDSTAINLISRLLTYDPTARIEAVRALAHPFFDELRYPGVRLPGGKDLPPIFDLSEQEIEIATKKNVLNQIIPAFMWEQVVGRSRKTALPREG